MSGCPRHSPKAMPHFTFVRLVSVEDYDAKMTAMRQTIEKPEQESILWKVADAKRRAISPSGMTPFGDVPEKIRLEYSTYVLAKILRLRIGIKLSFPVLKRREISKEDGHLTTEAFQSAWEKDFLKAVSSKTSLTFGFMVDLCQTLPLMCASKMGMAVINCMAVWSVMYRLAHLIFPSALWTRWGASSECFYDHQESDLVSLLLQKRRIRTSRSTPLGLSSPFHGKPRLLLAQRLVQVTQLRRTIQPK